MPKKFLRNCLIVLIPVSALLLPAFFPRHHNGPPTDNERIKDQEKFWRAEYQKVAEIIDELSEDEHRVDATNSAAEREASKAVEREASKEESPTKDSYAKDLITQFRAAETKRKYDDAAGILFELFTVSPNDAQAELCDGKPHIVWGLRLKEGVYRGPTKLGKPDGKDGTIFHDKSYWGDYGNTDAYGWIYTGDFRNGERHGRGVMKRENPYKVSHLQEEWEIYQGQFEFNEFISGTCSMRVGRSNGLQVITLSGLHVDEIAWFEGAVRKNPELSPWRFAGYPRHAIAHGKGRVKTNKGLVLEGTWESGDFVSGKVVMANGGVLEGAFKECRMVQGRATVIAGDAWGITSLWPSEVYSGQVKDGRFHGQGSLRGVDGNLVRLDGEFQAGKFLNGTGLRPLGADSDEGEWRNGELYNGEKRRQNGVFSIREGQAVGVRRPGTADFEPFYGR